MKTTSLPVLLRALCMAGALSLSAHATTLMVTTTADEMDVPAGANLSLREAVRDAAAGDLIVFAPALTGQTITLTAALGGEIVIGKNLTIDASSLPAPVTISGGGTSRIFSVDSGQTVALTGLTLTGGNAAGGTFTGFGGSILNTGSLSLTRCTVSGNTAPNGGGIGNANTGTATVNACTFVGNTAATAGGGLASQGVATVTRSTFSGNTAGNVGGGAVNAVNATTTNVTLENCTIVGNSATGAATIGGGVRRAGGTVTIKNCIVAGNTAMTAGTENLAGTITQTGANLTSGDPLVAALGNYGGPTRTRPPLAGSPAIDASIGSLFTSDQRGYPTLGVADLGAAEGAVVVTTTTDELDTASLSGTGISLREAVRDTPGGGAIGFAPALSGQTITLTPGLGGEIVIGKNLTIDASNLPTAVTISGGGTSRIFSVNSGQTFVATALTLTGGNGGGASNPGNGGVIFNGGTLSLNRCTVSSSNAPANGGGVHSVGNATVDSCTFVSNNADSAGGGINSTAELNVTRTTFSGNSAGIFGGGAVNGTAVSISQTLENCTIVGNSALGGTATGGGLRLAVGSGTMTIKNCVVASNTTSTAGNGNLSGPISQLGANLVSGNPFVAPLGNYGGPTPTHALLPASLARNAAIGSTFTSDQRGFPIVGPADLGAYEAGTLGTNYNAYIWETLPTAGDGTFTDPLHAATFDYDQDGVTNFNEWLAQTSAANPLSLLAITSLVRTGANTISVTFPSVLSRTYTLESATDLGNPTTWTTIPGSATAGTGSPITHLITFGTPTGFLRVRVGP